MTWGKSVLAAILIVCAVATAVTVLLIGQVQQIGLAKTPPLPIEGLVTPAETGQPQTILLIGSDRRFEGNRLLDARSDSMMLVRLDPSAPTINVMNVPRDLAVMGPSGTEEKINQAYQRGGAAATLRSLKELLDIDIHRVVELDFQGFRRAVNSIGCLYLDVDRDYYNRNLGTAETNYADIDIRPGYQKLCGRDALALARYRHTDDDLVRAARQQEILRQAKQQLATSRVVRSRARLMNAVEASLRTNTMSMSDTIRLLKLAVVSSNKPVRQVPFPTTMEYSFVRSNPEQLQQAKREFLSLKPPAQLPLPEDGSVAIAPQAETGALPIDPKNKKKGKKSKKKASKQDRKKRGWEKVPLVRVPGYVHRGEVRMRRTLPIKMIPESKPSQVRHYQVEDRAGKKRAAYRAVFSTGEAGQYYGVQGLQWSKAPLLRKPDKVAFIGGQRLELHYDGQRIRRIAWVSPGTAWWISNTLNLRLTNNQMLALAGSMRDMG